MREYLFFLLFLFAGCGTKDINDKANAPEINLSSAEGMTVVIQPFGKISEKKILFIRDEIQVFFKCREVRVAKSVELPQMAWYAPRKRYVADSLLKYLWQHREQGADKVIGLLEEDIASEKGSVKNYGVMGLGSCPGTSCVVSTFRIKIKAKTELHFFERYAKVCLHELGHTLGLPHCSGEEKCFMNDAGGTVKAVDKEEKWLCDKCRSAIKNYLN